MNETLPPDIAALVRTAREQPPATPSHVRDAVWAGLSQQIGPGLAGAVVGSAPWLVAGKMLLASVVVAAVGGVGVGYVSGVAVERTRHEASVAVAAAQPVAPAVVFTPPPVSVAAPVAAPAAAAPAPVALPAAGSGSAGAASRKAQVTTPPTAQAASTPQAAPTGEAPTVATAGQDAERLLIARMRSALRQRDFAAVDAAAVEHEWSYPQGRLVEERDAIVVLTAITRGADDARSRATTFLAAHPSSIYAGSINAALAAARK